MSAFSPARLARPGRPGPAGSALLLWGPWRWVIATTAAVVTALAIGVPTGIIETGLYSRMTPVLWWNYPVWAVSSILAGLVAATYVRRRSGDTVPGHGGRSVGATILSLFAVGCPVCNKLVVGLIGASGALSLWAPVQPLLGLLGVGMLAAALRVRLRGEAACALPPPALLIDGR